MAAWYGICQVGPLILSARLAGDLYIGNVLEVATAYDYRRRTRRPCTPTPQ